MRGLRHSGVRIIVPPGRTCEPTRVTCKLVRTEKVDCPPPLTEGEALASRILKMGPVGAKFTGYVYMHLCFILPFSLAICRPSGCTVASRVVGVGFCNHSQMRTSKCTCLISCVSIGLDPG